MSHIKTIFFIIAISSCMRVEAQMPLTKGLKDSIVTSSLKLIDEYYFFGTDARKINQHVKDRQKEGAYASITEFEKFIKTLAEDIQFVNHDKHLNFIFTPKEYVPVMKNRTYMELINPKMLNGGISEIKVLPGNIGYINVEGFGMVDSTVMAGVFSFLKNSSALIIDLRKNGGGMLSNILSSYLLPSGNIHLNTIFWRGQTDSIYTLDVDSSLRYHQKPVYLLTSSHTFSSAEEFAYDLKNLNRAKTVGETTGGGANPGGTFNVLKFSDGSSLELFVPTGKVENPISKTNWEGKGVGPDIACPAVDALRVAQKSILEQLIIASKDSELKKIYKDILDNHLSK